MWHALLIIFLDSYWLEISWIMFLDNSSTMKIKSDIPDCPIKILKCCLL